MSNPHTENNSTPSTQRVNNGQTTEERFERYVVVREGHRVSDREYDTMTDPIAIAEMQFWTKVANNHSYGEKVAIVKYDSKRHRVW